MAIDIQTDVIEPLQAAYKQAVLDLAALPGVNVSDDGRSIDIGAARDSLTKHIAALEQKLAQLGQPVLTQSVPYLLITSAR